MEITPFIIALILMTIGLVGIIIPGLPDLVFIFLGVLLYGFWTNFETINLTFLLIFLALTIFGYFFDWLGTILGAKKNKATNFGIIGALLGGILGIFWGGILGMILFTLAGTIIFEIIFAQKNLEDSIKAGMGSVLGMTLGIILKFVLAGIMIGLFLAHIF